MQQYVSEHATEKIPLTVSRNGETITKELQPVVLEDSKTAGFGVGIVELGVVRYPWYKALGEGFITTFVFLKEILVGFYALIKGLVSGAGVGAGVAGPVGVAKMTGQVARLGFIYLMQFTALLSLNLAVLNILPIPALDGGRLLFVIIGKIIRRPVTPKIEQITHAIGFVLLMILVVLVTARDVNLVGYISRLWSK
jgi:regulator of sigma E protease